MIKGIIYSDAELLNAYNNNPYFRMSIDILMYNGFSEQNTVKIIRDLSFIIKDLNDEAIKDLLGQDETNK